MNVQVPTNILFRVHEQPAVKAAREELDYARDRFDRCEQAVHGDLNMRRTLVPEAAQATQEMQQSQIDEANLTVCSGSVLAVLLAGTGVALAFPALAGVGRWLALGVLVGVPMLVSRVAKPRIEAHYVNRALDRQLPAEAAAWRQRVQEGQTAYDGAVSAALARLTKEQAEAPQVPAATVSHDTDNVRIGSLTLPRRQIETPAN